jgi:hypothetical protein
LPGESEQPRTSVPQTVQSALSLTKVQHPDLRRPDSLRYILILIDAAPHRFCDYDHTHFWSSAFIQALSEVTS